ncbi:MAG TPA: ParB/RepB/Spo0J family partition protein [Phycisphaerae bacterium]|nr:ParB/RepB/Spo0J family partition protein [Phycisphaerae bacterium]
MPQPPRRLGRGLSAILSVPDPQVPSSSSVLPELPIQAAGTRMIKVSQLRPNPSQPRREFPADQLKALADSIARTGIIQPIAVRPAGKDTYEIIVGERRWRAAQMAGVSEVPAVVREASDEQMLEVALVENIFREDLNAIDRATAYKRYCDTFGLTAEQVAQRLGEDRTTVTNYIRLLDLPAEVKQWVVENRLSMGHARCLLGLTSASMRVQVAKEAIERDLSVRDVEKLVRDRQAARSVPSGSGGGGKVKRPLIRELEQTFVRALGTRVEIVESARKGKGRVIIHYASLEDFDRLCERLNVKPGAE